MDVDTRKRVASKEAVDERDLGALELCCSCSEFVDGLADESEVDSCFMDLVAALNAESAGRDRLMNPDRPVPEENGKIQEMEVCLDEWATYFDDITGVELDKGLVEAAIREELKFMESLPVWRRIPDDEVPSDAKVIDTRWVMVNKGDTTNVEIRARLVAREIKGSASSEPMLFAATPPLDAFRIMISMAAWSPKKVLDFVDVRKAHLYGLAKRQLVIRLPKEVGGGLALLVRSLYGTRDAAACWEECVAERLSELGFRSGRASPCLYWNEQADLIVFVHGDDFVTLGALESCRWLRGQLLERWNLKCNGALGVEVREVRILNRILTRCDWGYQLEADPRHTELITRSLGLEANSRGLTTPGLRDPGGDPDVASDMDPAEFRSLAMRAAYLSLDRPELQYAVKELCRNLVSPTQRDQSALKRLGRFLVHCPRLLHRFPWQSKPSKLVIESDSDFAGDLKTRKSTSGLVAVLGQHSVAFRSKTQSIIALSTGEAELYALVGAISSGLGLISVLSDFGVDLPLVVRTDASAGLGTASRRGLGRTKHIHVQYLWIQALIANNRVALQKIAGDVNRSDLLTKHLAAPRMNRLLADMGFARASGHSSLALRAAG